MRLRRSIRPRVGCACPHYSDGHAEGTVVFTDVDIASHPHQPKTFKFPNERLVNNLFSVAFTFMLSEWPFLHEISRY